LPEVDNPMALALGWDGKNRRGMIVAGGTYLTRIRIWSINNQNQISKDEYVSPPALIGIKTKN
jgi:hypothetical protein